MSKNKKKASLNYVHVESKEKLNKAFNILFEEVLKNRIAKVKKAKKKI